MLVIRQPTIVAHFGTEGASGLVSHPQDPRYRTHSCQYPSGKGTVERARQTLQDRLVKEVCLDGISDIDTANVFLPRFIAEYNQRFAVQPQNLTDTHRKVLHNSDEISWIFRPWIRLKDKPTRKPLIHPSLHDSYRGPHEGTF